MMRTFALPLFFTLLASCQMTDTGPQTSTREERLALGQTVIDDCARTECGRLNLDSQLVENYAQIAELTHVTAFMASYTDFNDLSDIAAMTQLRELHIGSTPVRDLGGLGNFPNLRLLHAQGLSVEDFSAIEQLRQLEELALGWGDVGDLSYLRGLRNLKTLNLDNSNITSLDGLRGHPSLERLDLINTILPDNIAALQSLPRLRALSITDGGLSPEQQSVIQALRAKGVEILIEPIMIVC